jgi:hypothetical protein
MLSRSNDVIVLLGAGASAKAGIPVSGKMTDDIEEFLRLRPDWQGFANLYHFVKCSILYAASLRREKDVAASYNVETLVNTLTEIEKGQAHPIYPFVSDWKSQLLSLVGPEFRTVSSFREKIVDQVKSWVQPESKNKAKYYEGLKRLKNDLNFPLKVFSLNYDMCVEWLGTGDFRVETGFEQRGEQLVWDWRRFDEANPHREDVQIYLYKMHGSINWKRDENDNLLAVDYTGSNIAAMELPIIFGRDFKLEAGDPYLFYAFEFRRSTLESKLILVMGYGFGDGHINKMIRQALRASPTRKVVVVDHCTQEGCQARAKFIADRLGVDTAKIHVLPTSAEAFLCQAGIGKAVIELVPEEEKTVF